MSVNKSASFEKQIKKLQTVVDQLEQRELSLEKGLELYKEGLSLSHQCRKKLEQARQEITIFKDGLVMAFDPESCSGLTEIPRKDSEAAESAGEGLEDGDSERRPGSANY